MPADITHEKLEERRVWFEKTFGMKRQVPKRGFEFSLIRLDVDHRSDCGGHIFTNLFTLKSKFRECNGVLLMRKSVSQDQGHWGVRDEGPKP